MDISVKLLPKQYEFLMESPEKYVLYSGGRGCIVGETKLLTSDGEVEIKELVNNNIAPRVLSFNGNGFEWIQAKTPYLKSNEDTLEIKTNDNRSITVAKNHLFLTATGWKFASSCVVGERLLGYSAFPQYSNLDIYQQVLFQDAFHWTHKAQDSQCYYSGYYRLYDEPPLSSLNSDPYVFPLLSDVHEYNQPNLKKDDVADELVYKSLFQYEHRLSKKDYLHHLVHENQQLLRSSLKTYEVVHQGSYCKLNQNETEFVLKSTHPHTSSNIHLCDHAKDICDYKQDYYENNIPYQDHDYSHSYLSPHLTISIIQEITRNHHNKKIYDIEVPIYHNYIAHGLIHHNSGKSRVLAYAAFREASRPGNKVLLARKTLTDLKASTLESLFEIIPREAIEHHNKTDATIKIRGGGILQYRGLDRGMSVRSMNIGCLCLDEAIEFTEEEFEEMTYGLRSKFGSMQCYMATNPGPPNKDQWLYRKFFIEKNSDHKVITSSSYDNFYLPESFFSSFKYMDADRRKRMVDGEWVAIEGQVFQNFSRDLHVKLLKKNDYEEYILAIDWGQTHLAAFILCGVTKGVINVIEETAKSNLLIDQIKRIVCGLKEKYGNLQILYDPSAPILANELGNIGIGISKANNDVNVGIDRIRNRLSNGSLYIDKGCENLIREFENYVYKGKTEVPVKKGDDCLDALRYVCNSVDDDQTGYIHPHFLNLDEEVVINEEDMWDEAITLQNF